MAELGLVDVSIRDGNQSLWGATGLTTAQVLGIAPVVDRVGFRALDFTSSTHMGVAVRTHRENPWEKIRLTRQAMPNTPLQFIGTGMRFISWETAHPEVMQLVYDRLVASASPASSCSTRPTTRTRCCGRPACCGRPGRGRPSRR